ncbi:MAG: SagB/ThcOx family dehydrogenase [Thermodesulfobacteriota bacterium]
MPGMTELPEPSFDSEVSVEAALSQRRSARSYTDQSLTLKQLGQILWAAQGMNSSKGYRTAPSAGALYPLEIYVVAGKVSDLEPGVYKYLPTKHGVSRVVKGDKRAELSRAALGQSPVRKAPVVLVFCAVYARVTGKYGQRGIMYVHMEAGHAAQNVYLQSEALELGAVSIGAFQDEEVKAVLNNDIEEQPLYLMPVGNPR